MVPGNSRDDDNLPSPFEESDGRHLTDKENEASQASHAHFNSASKYPACVPLLDSHGENMYETVQSYTKDPAICKNVTDYMSSGMLQSSQVLEDGLRFQDFCDTGYENPQINANYIQFGSTAGGFEMNAHERIATRNWLQTATGSGASAFNSTIEVSPSNDFKFDAFCPSNIDGGFLALGLGGDLECKEEWFSSRDFPCTISPQNDTSNVLPASNSYVLPASNSYVLPASNSYVVPASTNYSNPSQKSTHDFFGFQRSPSAFSEPTFNPSGWASLDNDKESETVKWDTFGPAQNPYPYSFSSPFNAAPDHYHFVEGSGFAANSPGLNPTTTVPPGYEGYPASHSLPFNSFNTNYPITGFARHYDLASDCANPIWTAPPPTYQLQNSDVKKDRTVSFSIGSHHTGPRGSSSTHDYLGLPPTWPTEDLSSHALGNIPPFLGVHSSGPTQTVNLNPAQGIRISSSTDMFGIQIGKHHEIKPVKAGLLPNRTGGIQLDNLAQFNQEIPVLRRAGLQAKNNVIQVDNAGVFVGTGSGPQGIIPSLPSAMRPLHTGIHGPGPSGVQVHKPPPQTSSYVMSKSSLKKRAAEPPKVQPSWDRRKKFMHVNNGTQGVAVNLPPPSNSNVAYIKSSENVESSTPKLVGWNCLLCKLDLSFEPDNPVHQPTVKPAVAVLPCGHTFHDHCLQLITPTEEAKDPPCIPCAMGED